MRAPQSRRPVIRAKLTRPPRGAGPALLSCALLVIAAGADGRAAEAEVAKPVPRTPALMAEAKDTYALQCAPCHGLTGSGDGEAAYLLYPKPRDFRSGRFRLTSTTNRVPTDGDIFRTITRGIPASSMVSWGHYPADVRWGLAYLVRDFWKDGLRATFEEEDLSDEESEDLLAELTTPGEPIPLPPEGKDTLMSRVLGREIYVERCQSCHGREGRGDGTEEQRTDEGYPIRPADYTQGLFKGGSASSQLYYRIAKGMAGTPMPESPLPAEQIWDLVHYTRSLARPGAEEIALQGRTTIRAKRVTRDLSDDPSDPVWSLAEPQYISLRPLWWRAQRIDGLTVRALHDSSEIALLLSWENTTQEVDTLKNTQFSDAVAVQFSLDADPPFFGMGSAAKPVNIWHWKASWQQDALDRRDVEAAYPAMAVDYYSNTADGDTPTGVIPNSSRVAPTFLTGQAAGNPFSALERPAVAEDLNARAQGTLSSQPAVSQQVSAKGVWDKGITQVVLRRSLRTQDPWDVDFSSTKLVRLGFAVWDGAAGDRDGQKAVSIWHELELAQ